MVCLCFVCTFLFFIFLYFFISSFLFFMAEKPGGRVVFKGGEYNKKSLKVL